jgi:putative tricarboxylic transport membrane protein
MKADRAAGVVTAVAGLCLAAVTGQIDILASQPTLSARFFPFVLAAIFAALFLSYALTFRFVDFRFGTWAFVLVSMWILGSRKWIELLILPLAVSAATYWLFRHGFTVMLPVWI